MILIMYVTKLGKKEGHICMHITHLVCKVKQILVRIGLVFCVLQICLIQKKYKWFEICPYSSCILFPKTLIYGFKIWIIYIFITQTFGKNMNQNIKIHSNTYSANDLKKSLFQNSRFKSHKIGLSHFDSYLCGILHVIFSPFFPFLRFRMFTV